MNTSDIHVHQGDTLNRQYFEGPVSVCRMDDPNDDEGRYVVIKFANGGQLSIHTREPLMWIEPVRQ